jgi:hypothetical protein
VIEHHVRSAVTFTDASPSPLDDENDDEDDEETIDAEVLGRVDHEPHSISRLSCPTGPGRFR